MNHASVTDLFWKTYYTSIIDLRGGLLESLHPSVHNIMCIHPSIHPSICVCQSFPFCPEHYYVYLSVILSKIMATNLSSYKPLHLWFLSWSVGCYISYRLWNYNVHCISNVDIREEKNCPDHNLQWFCLTGMNMRECD